MPGHTLVLPVAEVDHWLDLDPALARRCMEVAQVIGQAQMTAFSPTRVGLIIAGLEVPHTHLHIIPIASEADPSFSTADLSPEPDALDDAPERPRHDLRAMGRAAAPTPPNPRPHNRAP